MPSTPAVKSKPARMLPKFGGEPVPWSPIVLPLIEGEARLAKIAAEYVKMLEKELNWEDDHDQAKWSGVQKAYIRRVRDRWYLRAQGRDPHYLKHGTFTRPFNADPPGMTDLWQAQTKRRLEEATGVRAPSTAEHKRKWLPGKGKHIEAIVKRMQKKYGTGTVKPPED